MNIVEVSGGKDSTAMLLKMIEEGVRIDRILFADTSKELPETYTFINKLSDYCFSKIGKRIETIRNDKSFDDLFYKERCRGKSKGQLWGYPLLLFGCWAQRDLKTNVIGRNVNNGDTVFIGFAKDEEKRVMKHKFKYDVKYPLIDYKMTEKDCMEYCKAKGMINPLYDLYGFKRLGCYLCPKQKPKDLLVIKEHYPLLWKEMLKKEEDQKRSFHPKFSLKEI